ncbi:hypothetical protein AO39_04063 [Mycobacterium tuberculosis M1762]|nr:hypothetical protein AO39_04063 [Mycobacterium tuberculosis M1762]
MNATLNTGRLLVNLKPWSERGAPLADIMARLDARARQVRGISLYLQPVQELNIEDRVSRGQYQFTLTSPDAALLARWSRALAQRLDAAPQLADISSDLQGGGRQAYLEVSRDAAARLGLTMDDVAQALYNAFGQRQVATLFTQSNQYRELPVMKVTKYPAEWVNAVAPSIPASAANTHDSRASPS